MKTPPTESVDSTSSSLSACLSGRRGFLSTCRARLARPGVALWAAAAVCSPSVVAAPDALTASGGRPLRAEARADGSGVADHALELLWTFSASGAIMDSPALGQDGTVYVSTSDGWVHAVKGTSGEEKWRYSGGSSVSAPAVDKSGTPYVVAGGARLCALNPWDGSEVWTAALQTGAAGPPVMRANGRLYVGQGTGNVMELDPATAQSTGELWVSGSPRALSAETLFVQGGLSSSNPDKGYLLTALELKSGSRKWELAGPLPATGLAVGPQGYLFGVAHYAGSRLPGSIPSRALRAIDPASGVVRWSVPLVLGPTSPPVQWVPTRLDPRTADPVVDAQGTVYLGVSDAVSGSLRDTYTEASICAFVGGSGALKWKTVLASHYKWRLSSEPIDTTAYRIGGAPVLGANGVLYASADLNGTPMLYALDTVTGETNATLQTAEVLSALTLRGDGTLFAGSGSGKLYAIASGSTVGLEPSPWPKQYGDARNTGNASEASAAPLLAAVPDQSLEAFRAWTYTLLLANAPSVSGPVVFGLEGSVPKGLGIDTSTGVLTWRPAQDQAPSTNTITVRVKDAEGAGDSRTFSLVVTAQDLLRWTYSAGAAVTGCPALFEQETLLVVSADNRVHALDPATGQLKWDFRWPVTDSGAVPFSPVVGDGWVVYIGSSSNLFALDLTTGTNVWQAVAPVKWADAPVLGPDAVVYLSGGDGMLYGLNGLTGARTRVFPGLGVPKLADVTMTLYSVADSAVHAFDTESGVRLWSSDNLGTGCTEMAQAADGTLYVGAGVTTATFPRVDNGVVFALDRFTGRVKWQTAVGGGYASVPAAPIVGPASVVYAGYYNSGIGASRNIPGFLVSWDASGLSLLEGATGRAIGAAEAIYYESPYNPHSPNLAQGMVNGCPALSQTGVAFVPSSNAGTEVMNALDTLTQAKLGSWPAGTSASAPAIGPEGTVYYGDSQGVVRALNSAGWGGLSDGFWPKYRGNARNNGRSPGSTPFNLITLGLPDAVNLRLGDSLTTTLSATDPLSATVRFTFDLLTAPAGMTLDPTHGDLRWTPTGEQVFTTNLVTVRVVDDSTPPRRKIGSFQVVVWGPNTAPELTAPAMVSIRALNTLYCSVRGTDADSPAQALTYSLGTDAPAGMAIDAHGLITWTSSTADAGRTLPVTVRVHDAQGAQSQKTISVVVAALDQSPMPGEAVWAFPTLFASVSSPALGADGVLYVGGGLLDRCVYALDSATGTRKWTFTTPDNANRSPALSAQRGLLYAVASGSASGASIYAIDVVTGEKRWEFNLGQPSGADPLIGPDGTVYVASDKLYALHGGNGTPLWSLRAVGSPAAIGPDGTLFTSGQGVYALETARGEIRWTFPATNAALAVSAAGVVFVASDALCAIEGGTGRLKWRRPAERNTTNSLWDSFAGYSPYLSLASNGNILVPMHVPYSGDFLDRPRTQLLAIDPDTGAEIWRSIETAAIVTAPTVGADGTVYALAADGVCYAFEGANGLIRWGLSTGPGSLSGESLSSPNLGTDGLLYFAAGGSNAVLAVKTSSVGGLAPGAWPRFHGNTRNTGCLAPDAVNRAPVLAAVADATLDELATLVATNVAIDADVPANRLTFSLLRGPEGMTLDAATGVLRWTPTEAQGPSTNEVVVQVADDGTPPLSATHRFLVTVREVNLPPAVAVPGDLSFDELATLVVTNVATDADVPANRLTFSLLRGPEGMTLDANTGVLRWTPTEAQGPSTNEVVVQVADDGLPALSATNRFMATVREVNLPPTLDAPTDQTIDPLRPWTAALSGADSDLPANTLTFSLVSGPTGMTVAPLSGVLNWTPTQAQAGGTYEVTVGVEDSGVPPLNATRRFALTVRPANVKPQLTTQPRQYTVYAGGTLVFTNTATDPNQPPKPLAFLLDLDQPPGASLDRRSGVFSWRAGTTTATNRFTIWVSQTEEPFQRDSQTFTVVTLAAPQAIRILGIARDVATAGVAIRWEAEAGARYQLEYKARLDDPAWSTGGAVVTASTSAVSAVDVAPADAQRFYRVVRVF